MNEEQLLGMKRKLDLLEKKRDRAKWEFDQEEQALLALGVKTPEEALQVANLKEDEAASLEAQMDKLWTETQEKFKALLEMV